MRCHIFAIFFTLSLSWHSNALRWDFMKSISSTSLSTPLFLLLSSDQSLLMPGWKIEKSASAVEEAKSVLPQSVTNASLDTWRGHSSLLSPGHSVPPLPPTPHAGTHTCMHFLHIHIADTVMYYIPRKQWLCFCFTIGQSALLITQPGQISCRVSLNLDFWISLPPKSVIIQPANMHELEASETYGYSQYIMLSSAQKSAIIDLSVD